MLLMRRSKSAGDTCLKSSAAMQRLLMMMPAELTPMASMRGRWAAAWRMESSMPSTWYWGSALIFGSQTVSVTKTCLPSITAATLRSEPPASKPMRQPSRCLPMGRDFSLDLGIFFARAGGARGEALGVKTRDHASGTLDGKLQRYGFAAFFHGIGEIFMAKVRRTEIRV